MALHCLFLFIVFFSLVSTKIGAAQLFNNNLQSVSRRGLVETTCDNATSLIGAEFDNFGRCSCTSKDESGGATAEAVCNSCTMCSFDSCGTVQVKANIQYETDGTFQIQSSRCFNFTSGVIDSVGICLVRGESGCSLTVNGETCHSCVISDCEAEGGPPQPLVDCQNLGYETIDLCGKKVTIEDESSPFIIFDSEFNKDKCTSGGRVATLWHSLMVAGVCGLIWSVALAYF